jgi:hypothetical protein
MQSCAWQIPRLGLAVAYRNEGEMRSNAAPFVHIISGHFHHPSEVMRGMVR